MEAERDMRFRGAWAFVSFSIFFLLVSTAACGEELYTRKDELQCGDVLVRAFTTCTEETDLPLPNCTEQHFIFSNQRTGTLVKIRASGKRSVAEPIEPTGTMMILDGLAGDWACVKGKSALYVILRYGNGGNCGPCEWYEVLDLKGRKLLTDKKKGEPIADRKTERFYKKWDSLGLPNPWPWSSFSSIKLQKTDK
jgi:hypothetical protein